MKSRESPSPTSSGLLLSPHKRGSGSITGETGLLHCKCVPHEISKLTRPQIISIWGCANGFHDYAHTQKKSIEKALVFKKRTQNKRKCKFCLGHFCLAIQRTGNTEIPHTHLQKNSHYPEQVREPYHSIKTVGWEIFSQCI